MERIETSPNFNELAGKYGTPKITIAFMIKRYEKEYYSDEKPILSRDTKSTIRRALELEFYDDLYRELYKISLLLKSAKTPTEEKKEKKKREIEILEFMKYDILGEIIFLSQQLMQNEIALYQPFTNQKVLFSHKHILDRLELLKTKFLSVQ
jgi:hypothetical protein